MRTIGITFAAFGILFLLTICVAYGFGASEKVKRENKVIFDYCLANANRVSAGADVVQELETSGLIDNYYNVTCANVKSHLDMQDSIIYDKWAGQKKETTENETKELLKLYGID